MEIFFFKCAFHIGKVNIVSPCFCPFSSMWCLMNTALVWEPLPQVVLVTEDEVGSGVEGGAHVTQATVTTGTLQTVLVPVPVQSLEHKAVHDPPVAPCADPRLPFGLERHKGDTYRQADTDLEVGYSTAIPNPLSYMTKEYCLATITFYGSLRAIIISWSLLNHILVLNIFWLQSLLWMGPFLVLYGQTDPVITIISMWINI